MIKKLQVFFIVLFISLSNTFSQAESNIKFVDIDYIFLNSAAGKIINTQIQKQSKTINDKALGYRKEINDEKKNLINQKNVFAKEEFRNKSIQLEKKINGYNKIISNENNELSIFRSKVKSEFSTQLKKILQQYAKDNSIQMIINKEIILIGKKDLDATKDILMIFDNEVKVIKVQ
jgi:outer membrane protein